MRRTLLIVSLLAWAGCWGGGDRLAEPVRIPHPGGHQFGQIAFRPPRGWQPYRPEELPCEAAFFGPKAEGYNSNLTLVFQENEEELSAYADKLVKEELPGLFKELEVEKSEPLSLGNVDGWQIVSGYKDGDSEVRCMRTIFSVEGWKVSLTFHCLARDFSDYEGLFSDCVESFEVEGRGQAAPAQGS